MGLVPCGQTVSKPGGKWWHEGHNLERVWRFRLDQFFPRIPNQVSNAFQLMSYIGSTWVIRGSKNSDFGSFLWPSTHIHFVVFQIKKFITGFVIPPNIDLCPSLLNSWSLSWMPPAGTILRIALFQNLRSFCGGASLGNQRDDHLIWLEWHLTYW